MAFGSILASSFARLQAGRAGPVYDEQAFRRFLSIERGRAEHSVSSFLLVLVTLRAGAGPPMRIAPVQASAIFAGLVQCLREVDFVGWYRQDRVVGAVLAQSPEPATIAVGDIARRISSALGRHLSSESCQHLRVRVVPPRARGRA
jgi:hypothetical protein